MNKLGRDPGNGRWILLLAAVAVCLVVIVFMAGSGKFQAPLMSQTVQSVVGPFLRASSWLAGQGKAATDSVWDILNVHEQNGMLRNEVQQLREQNVLANEYAAENIRLRDLLAYKQTSPEFDLLMARVIGREAQTWTRSLLIDRGSQHGLKANMPVVTPRGLVGVITEVAPFSAKVDLILDSRVSVGTLIQRTRVVGILEGSLGDAQKPRMVDVPRGEDIKPDDIVVTSGFGGIYPKGIMVGTIESVQNDAGGLLQYAVVSPSVDFQRLEDVAVITASREAPPKLFTPPAKTPGT